MATREDLLEQFQMLNIVPTEQVISKCLQICSDYNVDAEELVDQWIAYTSSNLRGAAPTVEYLEKMERKEYQKTKDQVPKKTPTVVREQPSNSSYNSGTTTAVLGTPKGHRVPVSRIQTPVQVKPERKPLHDETLDISSPGPQTNNYSKRTDAKSVVCSYGTSDSKFRGDTKLEVTVKPLFDDGMKANQRFMYEILGRRIKSLDNMTEDMIQAIITKHNIAMPDADEKIKGNTVACGRIISDSEGKINSQSVLLEQTQRHHGHTLSLNISNVLKYSLFPGQVVVAKGTHLKAYNQKDKLVVDEIFTDSNCGLLPDPPVTKDSLQIVVACGPFTIQDTNTFEPLDDLIQYVKENTPNLLILVGPFYERNNRVIFTGELGRTCDIFFTELIENIMNGLRDTGIQVVIVSSLREPHHFPVYPTPPYDVRDKYEKLTFMPDPCLINIDGLVIGATSADVLFHLSNFEMSLDKTNSGPPDRMGRLAAHLFKQQSFYPLDPPYKDMPIDMTLMDKFGVMGVQPHILILPSNLRYFVKEVDQCIVINPERLTKGYGAGTFSRIEVRPGSTKSVFGRTTCEVVKI